LLISILQAQVYTLRIYIARRPRFSASGRNVQARQETADVRKEAWANPPYLAAVNVMNVGAVEGRKRSRILDANVW